MNQRPVIAYGWIAILAVTGIAHGVSFRAGHDWGADYAWYWAQAESLIDGSAAQLAEMGSYRLQHTQGVIVGPAMYPWGFPVLLAAGHLLWGADLLATKIYLLCFYLAAFAVFYAVIRQKTATVPAMLILAVIALNPALFEIKEKIRSEPPFLLLFMTSVYLMIRFVEQNRYLGPRHLSLAFLGLCVFCAYWLRTHGIVLLPALFALQLIHRSFNPIPFMVFGLCWMLVQLLPGDTSYLGSGHLDRLFAEPFAVLRQNAIAYGLSPGAYFDAPKWLHLYISLAVWCLALAGAIKRRRDDHAILIVCACYASILVIYPFARVRFIQPILPFIMYFAFQGAAALRFRYPIAGAAAAVCMAALLVKWSAPAPPIEGPYTAEAQAFFEYVSETPEDSVFLFWKPRSIVFYAGRMALLRFRDPGPADYVAIYKGSENRFTKKRNAALLKFTAGRPPIFRNEKFEIYHLK